jgi:hypothetical protein
MPPALTYLFIFKIRKHVQVYQNTFEIKTAMTMLIAALFTIAKLRKQPRCPITDKWVKKMWYLYTMEFYAAMRKNEMLSFAGKWMELENIILSEVSLAQKTKNRMFSLICGHQIKGKHNKGIGL